MVFIRHICYFMLDLLENVCVISVHECKTQKVGQKSWKLKVRKMFAAKHEKCIENGKYASRSKQKERLFGVPPSKYRKNEYFY